MGCVDKDKPCPESELGYMEMTMGYEMKAYSVVDFEDDRWAILPGHAWVFKLQYGEDEWEIDCVEDDDGIHRAQGIKMKHGWFRWAGYPGPNSKLLYISDFADSNGLESNLFLEHAF